MSKNAASESDLGELHSKVARVMAKTIEQIDRAQHNYDKAADLWEDLPDEEKAVTVLQGPPVLSAPLMGVMTKFLADNDITCAPEAGSELSGLERSLRERKERRAVAVGNVLKFPKDDE